jgi:uncharacterized protein
MIEAMLNPNATRREFLTSFAASLAAAGLAPRTHAQPPGSVDSLVDALVYLGRWPFGRLHRDEPAKLAESLRAAGVTQAWAGSFEGLLHKDVAGVNARLAAACRREGHELFVPFGAINPTLPDWEEDLRRCDEEHRMPGIRLHPIWHGYDLANERIGRVLRLAAERRLIIQLECDAENVMRPFFQLPRTPIELALLCGLVAQAPGIRIVLVADDWSRRLDQVPALAAINGVYLAQRRFGAGLRRVAKAVGVGPLLLASKAPLFPPQFSTQVFESAGLSELQQRRIAHGTASEILAAAANVPYP